MTRTTESVRTFIALPLPENWSNALADVIAQVQRLVQAGVRWVDPLGTHLTLKFLGATDIKKIEPILSGLIPAATATKSLELSLAQLGTFPNLHNPRVIWAGVNGSLGGLQELQQGVEQLATDLGWARDTRPFRPHLTLGRMRDRATAAQRVAVTVAISNVVMPVVPMWKPNLVRLYRSELTPQGPIYTSLGDVALPGNC